MEGKISCDISFDFVGTSHASLITKGSDLGLGSDILWQDVPNSLTMAHNPCNALYISTLPNSAGHSTSYIVNLSVQPLGCSSPQPANPLQPEPKSGNPPPPPATGMLLFLLAYWEGKPSHLLHHQLLREDSRRVLPAGCRIIQM